MESFSRLFKKENMGELVLIILLVVYLILGLKTPEPFASMIDSMGGKIVMFVVVIYLFMNAHPILAVLSLLVAFDLMRRSSMTTGIAALQKFAPSEEKKMSQFTAYNQFPYTLEQEVVKNMTTQKFNASYVKAPFRPTLDDTHDAALLNEMK